MGPDFAGWATKAGLKCSDGRVIMPNAFQHQDGATVPLVWQHSSKNPEHILGHAVLKHKDEGVYAECFFNDTPQGKNAKAIVEHGDITSLSIHANQLIEKSKQVIHGVIREVSLVLAGANPGALIDFVAVRHSNGEIDVLEDEAIIFTGLPLEGFEHADGENNDPTLQEIYDSMTDQQKTVVQHMVVTALEMNSASHSDTDGSENDSDDDNNSSDEDQDLEHKEGTLEMNVFEQKDTDGTPSATLTHDDVRGIVAEAQRLGSLKAAVEGYALQHGITDIDILFPDAKTITDRPEFDKRRTEWVAGVLSGTKHSPFSRIKTRSADLTFEDARAKGYVKGTFKKEEWFGVAQRVTTPTTIYKKQKLDRDDIVDITDFDIVSWLKAEMRLMLEEELARAILIGDGRASDDEDKIQDGSNSGIGIRPIATEHELYNTTFYVQSDATAQEMVDAALSNRKYYKGTGAPTFYTTEAVLTKMLLARDTVGRRLWRNAGELADELRVSAIVPVEVMEDEADLVGVFVNLQDYVIGADKGGETTMFDDFDIDYNQYKYLMETRLSGALTKIKAALTMRTVGASAALVVPTEPSFVASTGVITIPSVTGVTYKNGSTDATVAAGAMSALAAGASLRIYAVPASASYYFENDANDEWTFTRDA